MRGPSTPRAAIDIGSNSLLLTVVDDEDAVLHDEATVVGLGRGLGDRGLFQTDRMRAGLDALTRYAQIAEAFGVASRDIRAVATSAARRAMNAETWFQSVREQTGIRIRIISGDEEARLTALGAFRDLILPDGPSLVIDLGGGSTELVLTDGDGVLSRKSLEIGSVRLTETFLLDGSSTWAPGVVDPTMLARLRSHVDDAVASFILEPRPRTVIGVAGTATTLASMALDLDTYDSERVHGSRLTRAHLQKFIDLLLPATPQERRAMVPTSPGRADFLLAGATILERVLVASKRQHMIVSDRGLRFGLLT
jgi:exopolyphosphatase/guanosine-5'-triphosphate,3'-diphosphate pyrophosphatase